MNKPYMNKKEKKHKWWAVDLDGTLAQYHGMNDSMTILDIGDPIPKMVKRIKRWLKEEKDVRIFTARVGDFCLSLHSEYSKEQVVNAIEKWCIKHIGQKLQVTCLKDYGMVEIWDDRCVQVMPNTGERINENSPRSNFSICPVCKRKRDN